MRMAQPQGMGAQSAAARRKTVILPLNLPGLHWCQSQQRPQQGGLAAAVGAAQHQRAARRNREIQPIDQHLLAALDADARDLHHGWAGFLPGEGALAGFPALAFARTPAMYCSTCSYWGVPGFSCCSSGSQ